MAQLKSTNVIGNLAVTGNVVASSIKIPDGTSAQFLKADGSVDGSTYAQGNNLTSGTILIGGGNSRLQTSGKTITSTLEGYISNNYIPTTAAVANYVTGRGYITDTLTDQGDVYELKLAPSSIDLKYNGEGFKFQYDSLNKALEFKFTGGN